MNDRELLDQYVRDGSGQALEELVRRHAGWLHSVARRRTRDPQLADDVMQSALIVLFRKPPRLHHDAALGSWLFRVVCHISQRTLRAEVRRKRREREFAMRHEEAAGMSAHQWEELAPHLDTAVLSLSEQDRQAVVLRFFQQKSHTEVATALGISHDAARQRVGRAVAKLRQKLLKCGVQVPEAGAFGVALSAYTVTAPPSLAMIESAIQATAGTASGAASTSLIGKGVLLMIAMNKAKLAATAIVVVLLAGTGVVYVARSSDSKNPSTETATAATSRPESWQDEFDRIYRLEPGENAKWIKSADFPPSRAEYGRHYTPGRPLPESYSFTFVWEPANSKVAMHSLLGARISLGGLLGQLGIRRYELDAPANLMNIVLGGDWIFRDGTAVRGNPSGSPETRRAVLEILNEALQRNLQLEPIRVERDVIVASGGLKATAEQLQLAMPQSNPPDRPPADSYGGDLKRLLDVLAGYFNQPIIDETTSGAARVNYSIDNSFINAGFQRNPAAIDIALAYLSEQSGLEFSRQRRVITVWKLEEIPPTSRPK